MGACFSDHEFKYRVTQNFPKILGIARNYVKHLQDSQIPPIPIIFAKPWSSLAYSPRSLCLSDVSFHHQIVYQIELGVYIGKKGYRIEKNALQHVGGYFLALDLYDQDLNLELRKKGLPIELCKGQNNFTPVTGFIDKTQIQNPYSIELELKINGKTVQKDKTENMHFKIENIITFLSTYMTLNEGDLILTGTPDGTGILKIGDQVYGTMKDGSKVHSIFDFVVV